MSGAAELDRSPLPVPRVGLGLPYVEGWRAFEAGKVAADNPHDRLRAPAAHDAWRSGFLHRGGEEAKAPPVPAWRWWFLA